MKRAQSFVASACAQMRREARGLLQLLLPLRQSLQQAALQKVQQQHRVLGVTLGELPLWGELLGLQPPLRLQQPLRMQ